MKASIETLFKEKFDLVPDEMEELKVYNVEEANVGILAYDEPKREVVYSKILNCIKKPATKAIAIKLQDRDDFEEPVSDKHMYAVRIEDTGLTDYAYAKDIVKGIAVYTVDGFKTVVDVKEVEKDYWLDVQTETGNYFANGILSHNSPMAHLNALTGGFAVNFYPSTRFRVTAREPIVIRGEIVGTKIKLKNYKNKTGQPFRECTVDVYFKDIDGFKAGMDAEGQYLDMLLELGLISQRGAWYYYREDDPVEERRVRAQGWAGLKTWFEEHPEDFEEAKALVKAKMSGYDENLDKNSVETSELEEIKAETKATMERLAGKAVAATVTEDEVVQEQ